MAQAPAPAPPPAQPLGQSFPHHLPFPLPTAVTVVWAMVVGAAPEICRLSISSTRHIQPYFHIILSSTNPFTHPSTHLFILTSTHTSVNRRSYHHLYEFLLPRLPVTRVCEAIVGQPLMISIAGYLHQFNPLPPPFLSIRTAIGLRRVPI